MEKLTFSWNAVSLKFFVCFDGFLMIWGENYGIHNRKGEILEELVVVG